MPKPIAFRPSEKAQQVIDRIMKEQNLSQSQAVIYALENFQSEPQTPFSQKTLLLCPEFIELVEPKECENCGSRDGCKTRQTYEVALVAHSHDNRGRCP